MLFSPISKNGQQKLLKSSVLVIGVGALGTSILDQLVRIGIGEITIVDRDYVELSNLQRQTLFTEEDVENVKPKAIAADRKSTRLNSSHVAISYAVFCLKKKKKVKISHKNI